MGYFKKFADEKEGFQNGDSDVLSRVYQFYYPKVKAFALNGFSLEVENKFVYFKNCWQTSDLEDIIQETFRKAFTENARMTYDFIRPYKNYLFTIAKNVMITLSNQKRRYLSLGDGETEPADSAHPYSGIEKYAHFISAMESFIGKNVEDTIENLEVTSFILGFLSIISPIEQKFFCIRFLEENSQEQTAETLGWTRSKVRKLETDLRKHFIVHISQSGYCEGVSEVKKIGVPKDAALYSRGQKNGRKFFQETSFLFNVDPMDSSAYPMYQ